MGRAPEEARRTRAEPAARLRGGTRLMDVKTTLKALTLEFRRELEGKYDAQGTWQAGDLERRLAAIGVRRDEELPLLFDPRAPEVALRPSVAALKRCVALLSGTLAVKGQEAATDEVFTAPDALGWTYQYWNTEEKDRVFEKVRTKKGAKIEGAEIVPATCIYTEPYMVKFLVQNSLGAIWMGMHADSPLSEKWAYYVRDAD